MVICVFVQLCKYANTNIRHMENSIFSRLEILLNNHNLEKLSKLTIAIFGLGGVGGITTELLCRSGIKNLIICDFDKVQLSNLNRQILYTINDIEKFKVDIVEKRLLSINPKIKIIKLNNRIDDEFINNYLPNYKFDFAIDAIDSLKAKADLIIYLLKNNIPFISSMGAAGKTDITKIRCDYIENTVNCRLSAVLKKKLRKQIEINKNIFVVYSPERQKKGIYPPTAEPSKIINGSIAHITNTFGAYCVDYFFKLFINAL